MSNKDDQRRRIDSEIRRLEIVQCGSGELLDRIELRRARMKKDRLDDAEGVTGPVDLVDAVVSYMADERYFHISLLPDRKLSVMMTPMGRLHFEKLFRDTIREQVRAQAHEAV